MGIRLEARDLNPASVGKSVRLRVRFGESADEAMSEIGEKGSVNEHSTRDMIVNVPWLGAVEFGESAFRFVRLDLVDPGTKLCLDSVRATFVFREVPWSVRSVVPTSGLRKSGKPQCIPSCSPCGTTSSEGPSGTGSSGLATSILRR